MILSPFYDIIGSKVPIETTKIILDFIKRNDMSTIFLQQILSDKL